MEIDVEKKVKIGMGGVPTIRHSRVYVHKALNKKLPEPVSDKYRSYISKQNLRSTSNQTLNVPKHKTQKYQSSPLFRTIKAWNSTAVETRSGMEINTFKKHFQTKLQTADER